MVENPSEGSVRSTFSFEWGAIRLELTGGEDLIRDAFTLLREEIMPKLSSPPAREESNHSAPAESAAEESGTGGVATTSNNDTPTPAEFYQQKKPKTEQERATVLAFYLKQFRDTTEFTVQVLEALFNEAHAPIKNVQNAVWNAGRKSIGWIKGVQGKRSIYYLTPAGESYVRTQLPKA